MGIRIISGGAGGGPGVSSVSSDGGPLRTGAIGLTSGGGVAITDNGNGTFTIAAQPRVTSLAANAGVARTGALQLLNGAGVAITDNGNGTFTIAAAGNITGNHKFRAHITATTSVPSGGATFTQIGHLVADEDPALGFAANQYVVQAGGAGLWFLTTQLRYAGSAAVGRLQSGILAAGNIVGEMTTPNQNDFTDHGFPALARLAVGDGIHIGAYLLGGANMNVGAGDSAEAFCGVLVAS